MELHSLNMSFTRQEVCDFLLGLLKTKLPSQASLDKIEIEGDIIYLIGCINQFGSHDFKIGFQIGKSTDGTLLQLTLHTADITNSFLMPGETLVNKGLSELIHDIPGISYSGNDKCLNIEISVCAQKYGFKQQMKINTLSFDDDVVLDIEKA